MILKFLGTGTSQGIPVVACKCATCKSEDPRDKRLRTSVFIQYKNVDILIDTGPDLRQQLLQNHIEELDAILLTHEHADHTAGLDDIRPCILKTEDPFLYMPLKGWSKIFRKDFNIFLETMIIREFQNWI